MELEASSANGSVAETPTRGKWRVRIIAIALFAALAAGAVLYGPAAVDHFLTETAHDTYMIPGVGEVRRITRVRRFGGRTHGIQEEWFGNGSQKSWARFDLGKPLESVHWSPEGLLDGWLLPGGGVEVIWVTSQESGGETWKEQARIFPSGLGKVRMIVEFRVDAMTHARENTPGSLEGYYTPEEIIEFVRTLHASAPPPRVELVIPPIQAPRRVEGAVPDER